MKAAGLSTKFFLSLCVPFLLNACSNDESTEDFDAIVDTFIVKKKIDGQIKSANAYYVYANNKVASATVTPPDDSGGSVSLNAVDDRKSDYHHEPDTTEFNLIPPEPGNYVFEIESAGGEVIQKTDLLKLINLTIPEIDSTYYSKSTLTLTVKWKKITDTDGLFIKLTDKEGDIVYISPALAGSVTELQIGTGEGNWISPANPGDVMILQIQSVVIEDNADKNYSLYNIEGTAIAEKIIIWGE